MGFLSPRSPDQLANSMYMNTAPIYVAIARPLFSPITGTVMAKIASTYSVKDNAFGFVFTVVFAQAFIRNHDQCCHNDQND